MRFSRQESWSGLPCPPPGDLPDPGIECASLTSPALASQFFTTSTTWELHHLKGHQSNLKWHQHPWRVMGTKEPTGKHDPAPGA